MTGNGFLIAHTGDIHIGADDKRLVPVIEWMISDAASAGVKAFAVAGDWYDGQSTPRQRNLSIDLLRRMGAAAPVYLPYGNHEVPGDLDKFASIETTHPIIVSAAPRMLYQLADGAILEPDVYSGQAGALLVCMLPWPRKTAYLGGDRTGTMAEQHDRAHAALRTQLDRFAAAIAAHDGPSLVVGHADVKDRRKSPGDPIVADDMILPLHYFTDLGASYVALGHEHMEQDLAPGVAYSGSQVSFTWGEAEEKVYRQVALCRGGRTVVRRPTPTAPMFLVTAAWRDGSLCVDPATLAAIPAGAEVRIQYTVDSTERMQAEAAAERLCADLLAGGAIRAQPDELVNMVHKSRGGDAVAQAETLWDKFLAWLVGDKIPVAGEEQLARWNLLVADAQHRAGVAERQRKGAALAVDAWSGRGIGMLGEFSIDLDTIEGEILAIGGTNGAGKTTCMGLVPGVPFLGVPHRGALAQLATRDDAFVESRIRIAGGETFTLRVDLPGKGGTAKGSIFAADGTPVMERANITQFKKWVAEKLPSRELVLATNFRSQKAECDLLSSTKGERKARLVETLGDAETFRKLCAAVSDMLRMPGRKGAGDTGLLPERDALKVKIERAAEIAGTAVAREEALRVADVALAQANARQTALDEVLTRGADLVMRGEKARADAKAAAGKSRDAREQLVKAEQRIAALKERITALTTRAAGAGASETARQELPALEENLTAARAAEDLAKAALMEAQRLERVASEAEQVAARALDTATGAENAATDKLTAAREQLRIAREGAAALGEVGQAAAGLDGHMAAWTEARGEQQRLDAAILASEAHDAEWTRRIRAAEERAAQAEKRHAESARGAAKLDEVRAAVAGLPAADAALVTAKAGERLTADLIARSERHDVELTAAREAAAGAARAASEAWGRGKTARDRVADVPCGGPDAQPTCEFLRDAAAVDLAALVAGADAAREAVQRLDATPGPDWYLPPDARPMHRDAKHAVVETAQADRDRIAGLSQLLPEMEQRAREAAAAAADRDQALAEIAAIRAEPSPPNYVSRAATAPRIVELVLEVSRLDDLVRAARAAAARLPDLQRAAAQAEALAAAVANAEVQHARAVAAESIARAAAMAARELLEGRSGEASLAQVAAEETAAVVETARAAVEAARTAIAGAAAASDAARDLAAARAELHRDEAAFDDADRDLVYLDAEAADAGGVVEKLVTEWKGLVAAEPAVEDKSLVERARRDVTSAAAARAASERDLVVARDAEAEQRRLQGELDLVLQKIDDVVVLQRAFGPNGIQALEISAAGPAIAEIVNQLLTDGWGSRYQVAIETLRDSDDGDRQIEDLEIVLVDSQKKLQGDAGELPSGGEETPIAAAVRLGLTIYGARLSGLRGISCFLDEPSGALAGENVAPYVAMLRKAVRLGPELARVVLVTHDERIKQLADVNLFVDGGRVAVGTPDNVTKLDLAPVLVPAKRGRKAVA